MPLPSSVTLSSWLLGITVCCFLPASPGFPGPQATSGIEPPQRSVLSCVLSSPNVPFPNGLASSQNAKYYLHLQL